MARTIRRAIGVRGVLAVGAVIAVAGIAVVAQSAPPANDVISTLRPDDAIPLTLLHVYDGDTIRAQAQAPNELVTTSNPIRIRLIGIDTPELAHDGTSSSECGADQARAHLAELLPEGSTVWASTDRETWDDYDRRLLNLWTDDGRFIAAELVSAGDAEAIRIGRNDAYYNVLAGLQSGAQSAGRGQWGACL